ncbi:MAG: thioredoxin family protein [Ignavibacteriales bacterium]|nr:thioredoxin family protein [Ignavibacteriales bacterium]
MYLKLIISSNCAACERAKKQLQRIQTDNPKIKVEIIHINLFKDRSIFITPALLLNNELFSYGDIDENKLLSRLN